MYPSFSAVLLVMASLRRCVYKFSLSQHRSASILKKYWSYNTLQLFHMNTVIPYSTAYLTDIKHINGHRRALRLGKDPFSQISMQLRNLSSGDAPRHLKLMQLTPIMLPSLLKMWKNMIFNMLIRSFDHKYSPGVFLDGARQVQYSTTQLPKFFTYPSLCPPQKFLTITSIDAKTDGIVVVDQFTPAYLFTPTP